jgi:dihydrofolate synthase/folylpolyglutamate synthase
MSGVSVNPSSTQYDPVRALDEVVTRLRSRLPDLIDLTTGRVLRLLKALGDPQDKLPPVIHVAGTNGKGSTCAYLRAMAEQAGLKAHVLTSPHLVRFAERVRVAGELISDERLAELIVRVEAANDGQPISFFELTACLSILAFAETPADVAIIEVGLGGRFDATNVFNHPAVTVIGPVDYDHLEMLGPEIEKIAWEKAGIMRPGVPCVVARQMDEVMTVIEAEAVSLGVPLTVMGRDIDAWVERGRLVVQTESQLLDLPLPSLYGEHQIANAGLAVAAALALTAPTLDPDGVGHARWPARFQRLTAGPLGKMCAQKGAALWLDGGHNPHAGRALADTCEQLMARDPRPLVLIVAMLDRKDPEGFLRPFRGLPSRVIATTFDSPNALKSGAVARAAVIADLPAEEAVNVVDAVEMALDGEDAPHILICGGLHFAGDVLALSPETWPR